MNGRALTRPAVQALGAWLAVSTLLACGQSYRAPSGKVTGRDAAPLGRVVDFDIELPSLIVDAGRARGVTLDATLTIDGAGDGRHEARVTFGRALAGGARVDVEDLSNGETVLIETLGAFRTGRIGPLRVLGTPFELALEGTETDRGWVLSGTSWESQTGQAGSARGWRRHRFLVAESDFSLSGQVALLEVVRGSQLRKTEGLAPCSPDGVARRTGDGVFVVNRLSYDNVQRLDPRDLDQTTWQAGLGQGANPQDVLLVDPKKLYVTRYEPPFNDVAILQAQRGKIVGTIPLAGLGDNRDGLPRAATLARAAGRVFVGLQDIDRSFSRYGEGKLAVIDPVSDTLERVVRLPGKNPGDINVLREGERETLYVALGGVFPGTIAQELSGGVAVVDPVAQSFERWALDDDLVSGNVSSLAVWSATSGYVVASTSDFVSRVVAFDPAVGTVGRTLVESPDYIAALALDDGGILAVPVRSFDSPRVCFFAVAREAGQDDVPLGCVGLTLPPFTVDTLDAQGAR